MLCGILRSGSRKALAVCKSPVVKQRAGIAGKSSRPLDYKRPSPFPYKDKSYGTLQAFLDKTSWRFDENSKIILVEGPLASGKSDFAKALADDLDMLYLPAVNNLDCLYISEYGSDLRSLNSKIPENIRMIDTKDFLENPTHKNVATYQIQMLMMKYEQYFDAICHLMNTGQGVVLDRSVYSDQIFIETMYKAGYVSSGARKAYFDCWKQTVPLLLKPHLVLYLDIPVSKVQENIKKRAIPYEVKSKVLSTQYLTDLERNYKEQILPNLSEHCELLVYDWSDGGDVEVVVEDIERIDFDRFERHDKKMKTWRFTKEWDLCSERIWYTKMKDTSMRFFNVPAWDVPELIASGEDWLEYDKALQTLPGTKFAPGFNADMGDKNILFKTTPGVRPSRWL